MAAALQERKTAARRSEERLTLALECSGQALWDWDVAGNRIFCIARGSTLMNFTGINHAHLAALADRNPLKHGLWTPGTDVRVLPPADALALRPDDVLIGTCRL